MKKILFVLALSASLFGSEMIEKASCVSVDATAQNIKNILEKKGLALFSIVDHSLNAKEVGMNLNPSKLIIFGNANVGTRFMQENIKAGLDLPLKILVYENSRGETKMIYRDTSALLEGYQINADARVAKVNEALDKITTAAAQCPKD